MGNSAEERTLDVLEWKELIGHLADRALSGSGQRMCLRLKPLPSIEESQREILLVTQMLEILKKAGTLPIEIPEGVRDSVFRCQKGERLTGAELAQIGKFLVSLKRVRDVILGVAQEAPMIAELAQSMEELASLREVIEWSLDPEGHLLDRASPRLGALRKELRRKREEISSRLDTCIKSPESGPWLQDSYYTVRDGRFVLPVRADARAKVQGIVHDVSSSGATVFIEPSWLVDLNNSLKIAELEVQREEKRILDLLSQKVAQRKEAMEMNLEIMARLDFIQAKARLSKDLGGTEPLIAQDGLTVLNSVCHPLLLLRNKQAVANDVILGGDARILVISGPNAGGKTVLLKALGLCVLMMKAGLHIPARENSRMSYFSKVFADIGDQQDIQHDFSTFSAHMRNLREILQEATPESLILVDEIAGSTDPQEGGALALAFLDELLRRGATVVATTHYPQVKAWAQTTPGAQNGAMEFDWGRLCPTYKLIQGLPGQSSALQIARLMGIPDAVIDEASRKLQGDELTLESLLQEAQSQRTALEQEKKRLQTISQELEELRELQKEALLRLRKEAETFTREKRLRLAREIQQARDRIKEILSQVSQAHSRFQVLQGRRELNALSRELAAEEPPLSKRVIPLVEAKPGEMVEIIPLGKRGVLLEELTSARGRVRVQLGQMEILVDKESLGGVSEEGQNSRMRGPGVAAPSGMKAVEVPGEMDLRGMRVEEALDELQRFLDRALLSSRKEVRIIHGHGTGALKRAVRAWLGDCQWIEGFRPGAEGEGGDGVTVVALRATPPQV